MTIDLMFHRGLGILIDGHKPKQKNWSYGDYGNGDDPRHWAISANKEPLDIGPHKVTGLWIDVSNELVSFPDNLPTRIRIDTTNGPIAARITKCITGDPNKDRMPRVKLSNGKFETIDEITLYVRAKTD